MFTWYSVSLWGTYTVRALEISGPVFSHICEGTHMATSGILLPMCPFFALTKMHAVILYTDREIHTRDKQGYLHGAHSRNGSGIDVPPFLFHA